MAISQSRLKAILVPENVASVQEFAYDWGDVHLPLCRIKVKAYIFIEKDVMNIRDNVYIVSTLIEKDGMPVNRGVSYIESVPNHYINKDGKLKIIKTPEPTQEQIDLVANQHFFAKDSLRCIQQIKRINF